jgi:hypothetical protein
MDQFIKRFALWLLWALLWLFLGYLFFHSVDVAATTTNNFPPLVGPDDNAWIDSQNNVAYKPNPPPEESAPPKPRPLVHASVYCSCVNYVKALTGFSTTIGLARNWPINSSTPEIGGVVITTESRPGTSTGHVAYIRDVQDGFLILNEANYVSCRQTTGRKLAIDSPLIIGYWNP